MVPDNKYTDAILQAVDRNSFLSNSLRMTRGKLGAVLDRLESSQLNIDGFDEARELVEAINFEIDKLSALLNRT
jgi:hypothetical protein